MLSAVWKVRRQSMTKFGEVDPLTAAIWVISTTLRRVFSFPRNDPMYTHPYVLALGYPGEDVTSPTCGVCMDALALREERNFKHFRNKLREQCLGLR